MVGICLQVTLELDMQSDNFLKRCFLEPFLLDCILLVSTDFDLVLLVILHVNMGIL